MTRDENKFGWHFVGATLRDGQRVPKDGVWLIHKGPLELCESGLHFSREPFDAMKYAPGNTLCLVEVGGKVIYEDNKGVASRRKIIARMDAGEMLRYFARMQAVSVLHLWDKEPPEVVCDYLMTGDGTLRAAARAAAWVAAWNTADDAADDAAVAAAVAAAMAAAMAASGAAARTAAMAASGAAARTAARAAAWDAARQEFNSLVYECFEDFL